MNLDVDVCQSTPDNNCILLNKQQFQNVFERD